MKYRYVVVADERRHAERAGRAHRLLRAPDLGMERIERTLALVFGRGQTRALDLRALLHR